MCPKAFFLIVSRSRMMFHAAVFLSEKFNNDHYLPLRAQTN